MLTVRVILILLLVMSLFACEKQRKTSVQLVTTPECAKGVNKKQINDLIAILKEFSVARTANVSRFLGRLGSPKYPLLVDESCYDIEFIDVLIAVIPNRMVSFELTPFNNNPAGIEVRSTYKRLLRDFAKATQGEWKPYSVRVFYRETNGVVTIDFYAFDKKYNWRVDQHEAIDRVGDEFFDNLFKLEASQLSGMYYNLSGSAEARYAYLPKKLVPELSRLGVK